MARELKVLGALDAAKTQWYHFTAIVIAGMGFFTDAYDLFCISLVTKLLGRVYYYRAGPSSLWPSTVSPSARQCPASYSSHGSGAAWAASAFMG